jgi:hypothetical protein
MKMTTAISMLRNFIARRKKYLPAYKRHIGLLIQKLVGILIQKLVGILIQKLVGILIQKLVGILMQKYNHWSD